MGAFEGVSKYFNKPLVRVAEIFNYDDDNIVILEGDYEKLRVQFPDTYNNLVSCRHHADRRTPLEYGQDLVASWLFEDSFLESLRRSNSFEIELDGADKNRKILSNTKTSAASDYIIKTSSGERIKVELMCDYTGFWSRTNKLHLRDAKYIQLKKSKSLFIAVSPTTNEFSLFDFSNDIQAKYIESHRPYGGKPAYELSISSNEMYELKTDVIIDVIETTINNR